MARTKHPVELIVSGKDRATPALRRIGRSVRTLGRSVRNVGRAMVSMRSMAVGAFAVFATTRIVSKINDTADALDRLGKTAKVVGVTAQALAQYRHAAELAGLTTEQLDESFVIFARTLGKMKAGTGGALDTLAKKNMPALRKLLMETSDTGDALDIVFQSLAAVGDDAAQAEFASAAFGRSGARMVNMIKGGYDKLLVSLADAKRLGIAPTDDEV
ncbi:hypothetical protein DRH27_05870, partial [Candidatus Falkowbacteria bacterium]